MMEENEEALILKNRLRRLDPGNEIFAKEKPGSVIKIKRIEASDLEEEWSKSFQLKEKSQLELVNMAKATIASLGNDEILKNYADLVFCFNTMELYVASLKILEQVKELLDEKDVSVDLEFNYLYLKTLIGEQKYFEAYDLVTTINGSIPMVDSKRIEFLYIQGEVARKLGRIKEAIKSYLLVKKIDPKYRLINQRLQSFG